MTLWGRFARRSPGARLEHKRLETPDGDFLELLRLPAPDDAPRLLVLHGLEGSARSHYIGALVGVAQRRGWGMDVLLFRSCGSEPNRMARFYHSGETGDLDFVLSEIMQEFPNAAFALAGFSLGGNVLLKWLGERGSVLPPRLHAAAAVSVPFDLAQSAQRIGTGFSRVYERAFLQSLKGKAREKARRFPANVAFSRFEQARTLREFDDTVTAPLHGFRDAGDYYAQSSSVSQLASIRLPTLLLSAVDDPFLPASVLASVEEIARAGSALTVEFVPRGGHVGFVGGRWPWRPVYYAEERVASFCAQQMPSTVADMEIDRLSSQTR